MLTIADRPTLHTCHKEGIGHCHLVHFHETDTPSAEDVLEEFHQRVEPIAAIPSVIHSGEFLSSVVSLPESVFLMVLYFAVLLERVGRKVPKRS